MKTITSERLILAVIDTISARRAKLNIQKLEEQPKMHALAAHDSSCSEFILALCAVAVRFQQTNRPKGTHDLVKPWFSEKHGMHGYKTKCFVLPTAFCIHTTRVEKHF